MKFIKSRNQYEASNVTFNPEFCSAYSYRWWKFVARVEGKVIFNNYYYSPSTARHQRKVRRLLEELGIRIDQELALPRGITQSTLADLYLEAEEHLCDKYLNEELKREARNERARQRRLERKAADDTFKARVATFSKSSTINPDVVGPLLAAAPELRDALDALLTYFDEQRAEGFEFDADTTALVNRAVQALGKAGGKDHE